MSLSEKYRRLRVTKDRDVEELVDLYFHRPLAAMFGALILDTPVTPNHVTYASLAAGWAGAGVLYWGAFVEPQPLAYLVAAALLFSSVILDCADGQIARAKGGGTRMGRIIDGVVDALVVIATYVVVFNIVRRDFGTTWAAVTFVAGFNAWGQIVAYDKLKSMYLARAQPAATADGVESAEALEADYRETQERGTLGERIMMFLYVRVLLRIQDLLAPGDREPTWDSSPEAIERFRRENATTMRIATFLGLGTHMIVIYTAVGLAGWWLEALLVMQLVWLTIFNAILAYSLIRGRRFSR